MTGEKTKTGKDEWEFVRHQSQSKTLRFRPSKVAPADRTKYGWHKRPSIFLPKADNRITLRVTDVRVQRLQDISRGDAMDEGVEKHLKIGFKNYLDLSDPNGWLSAINSFRTLWDSIHQEPFKWHSNPFVVAYTFEVHRLNIDQFIKQEDGK